MHIEKKKAWKPRDVPGIVCVWPRFYSIPPKKYENFEVFCFSKLVLYKPFQNMSTDIGISSEIIIENWKSF